MNAFKNIIPMNSSQEFKTVDSSYIKRLIYSKAYDKTRFNQGFSWADYGAHYRPLSQLKKMCKISQFSGKKSQNNK